MSTLKTKCLHKDKQGLSDKETIISLTVYSLLGGLISFQVADVESSKGESLMKPQKVKERT